MKDEKMLPILVLLQLAFSATYSAKLHCGTYYLSKSHSDLYVERGRWLSMSPGMREKVKKLTVQPQCLLFAKGKVYEPNGGDAHVIDAKLQLIECCCELWTTPNERFLNRHVINGVPAEGRTWNDDMKARCIPIESRLIHTFLITRADDVQKVCGTQGRQQKTCRSENKFSYVDTERKKNGHYTNNYKQDDAFLVVRCENLLPIHYVRMEKEPNVTPICN